MGYWPIVNKVLMDADIILLILDARMPELSRNKELEEKVERYKKQIVYVFNKIDLISKESLNKLKKQFPDAFFVSGSKNIAIKGLKVNLYILGKKMKLSEPRVGVVGYPNVGKSAIINALAHRAKAKVSVMAGTTKGIQFIKAGNLRILDSPGVVPFEDNEVKLGVLGAKNPEKIKNLDKVAFAIIKNFVEVNKEALERFYGIKIENGEDEYEIILKIGRKKYFLIKGGRVDEHRTVLQIIKDWQRGRLKI